MLAKRGRRTRTVLLTYLKIEHLYCCVHFLALHMCVSVVVVVLVCFFFR